MVCTAAPRPMTSSGGKASNMILSSGAETSDTGPADEESRETAGVHLGNCNGRAWLCGAVLEKGFSHWFFEGHG